MGPIRQLHFAPSLVHDLPTAASQALPVHYVGVDPSVEVVHLVLDYPGGPAHALHLKPLILLIETCQVYTPAPGDFGLEAFHACAVLRECEFLVVGHSD
jgi:hypothetical protein